MKLSRSASMYVQRLLQREVAALRKSLRQAERTAEEWRALQLQQVHVADEWRTSGQHVGAARARVSRVKIKLDEAISVRDGWNVLMEAERERERLATAKRKRTR